MTRGAWEAEVFCVETEVVNASAGTDTQIEEKTSIDESAVVPSVGPDFETIFFMMRRARLLGFIEKGMFF